MRKPKILMIVMAVLTLGMVMISCSEDDNEVEEYPDWQANNDNFFNRLSDSVVNLLAADPARTDWRRIKAWSKPQSAAGNNSDYIIVNVLHAADVSKNGVPAYTDTVKVAYVGQLLPSNSYPSGFIFDQTFSGEYDPMLSATTKFAIGNSTGNNLVDGFATALQHMRKGDRWKVYIPYQLGYGEVDNGSIPAYSTLIFDLVLVDFWSPR